MRTSAALLLSLLPLAFGQGGGSIETVVTRLETIYLPVSGTPDVSTAVVQTVSSTVAAQPTEAAISQSSNVANATSTGSGNVPIPIPVPIPGNSNSTQASSVPAPAPSASNGTSSDNGGTGNSTTPGATGNNTTPEATGNNLNFGPIAFAGYDNYVFRDNVTAAQVVVSQQSQDSQLSRFITAFPNGNTGALVYFLPYTDTSNNTSNSSNTSSPSTLTASLVKDSIRSVQGQDSQVGITGKLALSGDVEFGVTLLGSVRTLRDYVESGGRVMNPLFNYTLGNYDQNSVELVRKWVNGSTVQYLRFEAGDDCEFMVSEVLNGSPQNPDGNTGANSSATQPSSQANATAAQLQRRQDANATEAPATPTAPTNNTDVPAPTNSTDAAAPTNTAGGDETTGGNGATLPPPTIRIVRKDKSTNATVTFTSTFNFTGTTPETPYVPLEGLGADQVFLTNSGTSNDSGNATGSDSGSAKPLDAVLEAIHGSAGNITQQMAFLSYKSEFLAGGWRFLTYFGRDTLIALRLLMPILSPEATESILAAVIQRTNDTTGELCHEETIGDYASFLNMHSGHPEKGNTPVYAYTMVDTDFLLLPVLADYAASSPDAAKEFLARNSSLVTGTFAQLLETNIEHVLTLAAPFGAVPHKNNLVKIRTPPVGNWRDSGMGLGGGSYPFDVNCALVPAALKAISTLASSGLVSANYTNSSKSLAQAWSDNACEFFSVSVDSNTATSSLNSYVSSANLSTALLYGAGSLNGSSNSSDGWSTADQVIGGSNSSSFYALSLTEEGEPIPVLNSDLSFVLEYADPSREVLWATVQALQSYPRGLLTNVGMVVANGAYDSNGTAAQDFSNKAYHGAVSWSWQTGMMAQGLSKQLGRCGLSQNTQLGNTGGNNTGNGNNSTLRKRQVEGNPQTSTPAESSPASTVNPPADTNTPTDNNNVTTPAESSPASTANPPANTTPPTDNNNTTTTPPEAERPAWCDDSALVDALQQAQKRLWASIDGTSSVLYTEVWSPVWTPNTGAQNTGAQNETTGSFSIGDLGKLSPEGTEGDAIQLWSYGFLAAIDPRNGVPVAAGLKPPQPSPVQNEKSGAAALAVPVWVLAAIAVGVLA